MVNSVDNGYNPVWMNNVPPAGMPLRNGNRSHSQVLPQRSGPFQMSHIAAAFVSIGILFGITCKEVTDASVLAYWNVIDHLRERSKTIILFCW